MKRWLRAIMRRANALWREDLLRFRRRFGNGHTNSNRASAAFVHDNCDRSHMKAINRKWFCMMKSIRYIALSAMDRFFWALAEDVWYMYSRLVCTMAKIRLCLSAIPSVRPAVAGGVLGGQRGCLVDECVVIVFLIRWSVIQSFRRMTLLPIDKSTVLPATK